jgi:hypothetical protein
MYLGSDVPVPWRGRAKLRVTLSHPAGPSEYFIRMTSQLITYLICCVNMRATWRCVWGQQPRNACKQSETAPGHSLCKRGLQWSFSTKWYVYWGSLGILEISFFIGRMNTIRFIPLFYFSLYMVWLFHLCLWPSVFFPFIIFFPRLRIPLFLFFYFSFDCCLLAVLLQF